MKLIKRYRNNNYYNTVDKHYTTLTEMAESSCKFIVKCYTGRDLTDIVNRKIQSIREGKPLNRSTPLK
jgi:polyhydroxyalkanoate synthesis regulator protein